MFRLIAVIAGVLVVFASKPAFASACEEFTDFSTEELKELREMLNDTDADPLDRLFALETMVCSDSPNIRHYAMKQGMEKIDEPLVRNEIMLKALLEKSRIDVEIGKAKNMSKQDKAFITEQGGVYSNQIMYRSESEGCISLYYKDKCATEYGVYVRGDRVELNYQYVSGVFHLSKAGELVGTLRARNNQNHAQLPAVIRLF